MRNIVPIKQEQSMPATHAQPARSITRRKAERADIPFLVEIEEMASTAPFEQSMWDQLVEPFGMSSRALVEVMFATGASNWGGVEDFLVVEVDGQRAAACAVFDACFKPCDRRTLKLERLPEMARRLCWDAMTTERFREHYEMLWGPADPIYLQPQAAAIIECVGVLPAFRGLGLGDLLMREAKDEARRRGHDSIGIMAIRGNDRAEALYERHFERYATFYPAAFSQEFPGVTKYRSKLEPAGH
jgi:GNAT superfamily N-acetyltransferase